jgi:hypothetical protein
MVIRIPVLDEILGPYLAQLVPLMAIIFSSAATILADKIPAVVGGLRPNRAGKIPPPRLAELYRWA